MSKKAKKFNCVDFKHGAQSKIYRAIAPMSARDQAAYFEALATEGSLGCWWKTVRRRRLLPGQDAVITRGHTKR